jgi:hypothetical protein
MLFFQQTTTFTPSYMLMKKLSKYMVNINKTDFKTAGRVKGHKDIGDYKLQLAFYACAHNEMFGTNIRDGVILMVAQTGFPMEFNVKLDDYMDELKSRVGTFWSNLINRS